MQIAAHARQIYFWTEQEDEVYQNYQAVTLDTAIDFDAEYPIDKIERRKLDLTIFDLQARVSLEFIKLLIAPARVPHPLQGFHRIVIAHPRDNDCSLSPEYDASMLQGILEALLDQHDRPKLKGEMCRTDQCMCCRKTRMSDGMCSCLRTCFLRGNTPVEVRRIIN